jgi:LmbE family N-acetylglucosaminyl deacetylase
VLALYLTTGVPARAVAWRWRRGQHEVRVGRRRAEALAAAARLQIEPLAFSDWPSRDLRSHLVEARALIAHHLAAQAADRIWAPAYEGGHQDHDVANFLASTFRLQVPVVEFSEYNAVPGARSNQFPAPTGAETVLRLSAAESAWKVELLGLYRSERANLRHIRVAREALRPLAAAYDYRRPPHPGRLFYERFQWLPFRHPRVDFTSPADVSAAIDDFPCGAPKPSGRKTDPCEVTER